MFNRPTDLSDADVRRALSEGWGLDAAELEYAPVGFGSHHWRAVGGGTRWFVTVDDLDSKRRVESDSRDDAADRLSTALRVARALRDHGLEFVVAPESDLGGAVLRRIGDRNAIALYPHVEGATRDWGRYRSRADRLAVLDRVVAMHAASAAVEQIAVTDDFAIPRLDVLELALTEDRRSWGPGPHAAVAHELLQQNADEVIAALQRYDGLVESVAGRVERMVITHGEPHRANTIDTAGGVVLVDWDTALYAPPERDLWALMNEEPRIGKDYAERTGVEVDRVAVELYRLGWDLREIAGYIALFRAPHGDMEDTRVSWAELMKHLDPRRWVTAG